MTRSLIGDGKRALLSERPLTKAVGSDTIAAEGRCCIKRRLAISWGPRKSLGFCGERRRKEAGEGIPVRVFRPKRTLRRRRRGVMLMWRKRLYSVLRFLVLSAFWAYILTIKAC